MVRITIHFENENGETKKLEFIPIKNVEKQVLLERIVDITDSLIEEFNEVSCTSLSLNEVHVKTIGITDQEGNVLYY